MCKKLGRALSDDELLAELFREAQQEEEAEKAWRAKHPVDFTLKLPGKCLAVVPFAESGSWQIKAINGDGR